MTDPVRQEVVALAHTVVVKIGTNVLTDARGTLDRARVRLDASYVCKQSKAAVDILNNASGASSIYESVPMQRIDRDMRTLNLHAILHPSTNNELYGRIICGLEPNTAYI